MDAQQVIGPPKRVRGHTRKQAIWDFEPGKRLTVTFDAGQPVGKEAKELTSFLGTIAKMSQHIDISITDWRKVPEEKKDDLWSIVKVANDSSSVHNHGPYGNSTSTRASQNKKSAKAVTSPGASNKITHLSSAEIQLRTKFLEEDSELMKLHQQFVMSGLMLENEFWCIRKVRQRVGCCRQTLKGLKREDVQLLRRFGIQFKEGFENAAPGNANSCQRR